MPWRSRHSKSFPKLHSTQSSTILDRKCYELSTFLTAEHLYHGFGRAMPPPLTLEWSLLFSQGQKWSSWPRLFKRWIALSSGKITIQRRDKWLHKAFALSTGQRFIQWIALSTFWTTGAWTLTLLYFGGGGGGGKGEVFVGASTFKSIILKLDIAVFTSLDTFVQDCSQ